MTDWRKLESYPRPFHFELSDGRVVVRSGTSPGASWWQRLRRRHPLTDCFHALTQAVESGELDDLEPHQRAALRWHLDCAFDAEAIPHLWTTTDPEQSLRNRRLPVPAQLQAPAVALDAFDAAHRRRFPVTVIDRTPALQYVYSAALHHNLVPHALARTVAIFIAALPFASDDRLPNIADKIVLAVSSCANDGRFPMVENGAFREILLSRLGCARDEDASSRCVVLHGTSEPALRWIQERAFNCVERPFRAQYAVELRTHGGWPAPPDEDGFYHTYDVDRALGYARRAPEWLWNREKYKGRLEELCEEDLQFADFVKAATSSEEVGLIQLVDASPGQAHRIPYCVRRAMPALTHLNRVAQLYETRGFAGHINAFQRYNSFYPLKAYAYRIPRRLCTSSEHLGGNSQEEMEQAIDRCFS